MGNYDTSTDWIRVVSFSICYHNSSRQRMKFFLLFTKKSVSEWFACYYDYDTMKKIIEFCRRAEATKGNIIDMYSNQLANENEEEMMGINQEVRDVPGKAFLNEIMQMMDETNRKFFEYHSFNKRVVFVFCQMKIHELSTRLKRYEQWSELVNKTKDTFVSLTMNCYAEFKMLLTMTEINLQAYRKIKKKHLKSFSKFNLPSPHNKTDRITRTYNQIQSKTNYIESLIESKKDLYPRQARSILTEQIESSNITSSLLSFIFGIGIGFSLSLMVANFILIGLHLPNHDIFENEYRLWRGIGFFVLYLWVTSISSHVYFRQRLNESLIFNYEEIVIYKKTSLGVACFFSVMYSIFLVLYVMGISGIRANPKIFTYFPAIIWGCLLLYIIYCLFTSSPFRSRLKSLLQIVFVPFAMFNLCSSWATISFSSIWATEQLISLLIPITDSLYTFQYYTKGYRRQMSSQILMATEIMGIIVFSFRFLECLKEIIRNNRDKEDVRVVTEMLLGFKSILNIILIILSITSTNKPMGHLIAWIVIGILTAIYNFVVDVVCDWDLIYNAVPMKDSQKDFLKLKDRMHPKNVAEKSRYQWKIHDRNLDEKVIILIICLNFIFRIAAIVTICPMIIRNYTPFYTGVIITVAVFLQLCRRLVWNLLRVQREHLTNCSLFRVRTDYIHKQEIVQEEMREVGLKMAKQDPLAEKRKVEEMETIKRFLRHKKQMKKEFLAFIKDSQTRLEEIQSEAQDQYLSRHAQQSNRPANPGRAN